jgi:hypothetical protein
MATAEGAAVPPWTRDIIAILSRPLCQTTMAALPPLAFAPGAVPPLDLALDDIIKMHKKEKKKAPVRGRCAERRRRLPDPAVALGMLLWKRDGRRL